MLNTSFRQTAEPVCMCVSWALTLFFSLSWRQLPWGSSSHGSTRKPWSQALQTAYIVYVWVCHSLEHQLPGVVAPCSGIGLFLSVSLRLIFIPSLWWDSNSQFWHLIQAADWKKNKVNPKAHLQTCVCTEFNSIPQTSNFPPHHSDPQLERLLCHLYLPSFRSICGLTSSRWPLSDMQTDTVNFVKRLREQRHNKLRKKTQNFSTKIIIWWKQKFINKSVLKLRSILLKLLLIFVYLFVCESVRNVKVFQVIYILWLVLSTYPVKSLLVFLFCLFIYQKSKKGDIWGLFHISCLVFSVTQMSSWTSAVRLGRCKHNKLDPGADQNSHTETQLKSGLSMVITLVH